MNPVYMYSVILVLCTTYFHLQVQAKDYYFSDFCQSGLPRNATLQTTTGGVNMTGSIKESWTQYLYREDCTLQLNPPPSGYGIALTIKKIDLRRLNSKCLDTITISEYSSGQWKDKLQSMCQLASQTNFKNPEKMKIRFKTGSNTTFSTYGKSFHIVYTTYYKPPCGKANSFRCSNSICISKNLTCDDVNNCGDNSDESNCRKAGAIAGGIIGGVVLFLIAFVIATIIYRRRRVLYTSITTASSPQTNHGYPLQSYTNTQAQPHDQPAQQRTKYTHLSLQT